MHICIVTPYAEPEKGACAIRVDSFRDYFEGGGNKVTIFAPKRMETGKGTSGVIRYEGIKDLTAAQLEMEFDIVVGTSPPMFHSFLSLVVCKFKRKPFILDVRDPWTYAIEKLGLKSSRSAKLYFYKNIERLTYRYADLIFVVNPFLIEIVSNFAPDEKIALVPNGADTRYLKRDKNEGKKVRARFGIPPDAKVLSYIGGLGDEEISRFLELSKWIVDNYDCHFLFVVATDGTPESIGLYEKMESMTRREGVRDNFHLTKNVEYSKVYKYLSASDLGICPFPDWMDYCLPTKIYDYLACEVPVIAKGAKRGAMQDFFESYDVGYYATDWSEFKEKMKEALDDMDGLKKRGKNGRKIVTERFTREMASELALKKMHDLLHL